MFTRKPFNMNFQLNWPNSRMEVEQTILNGVMHCCYAWMYICTYVRTYMYNYVHTCLIASQSAKSLAFAKAVERPTTLTLWSV